MESIKVAEIFAEMGLNLDEKSITRVSKKFESIGKQNAKSVSKPMEENTSKIEQSMDFITKSIKGFIAISAIKTAFNFAMNSAKEMNSELEKSIGLVDSLDNLSADLNLSFQQAQQLNISAMLGDVNEGELKSTFTKFQETLKQLKSGESNDATNVLQSVLGDYLDKENDLQLYGRLISSNKHLDEQTANKNTQAVFGNTSGKMHNYLMGSGYDNLVQAHNKKGNENYYISDKKQKEYKDADKKLKINAYENNIKNTNSLDVGKQLQSSLNASELNQEMKNLNKNVSVVGDTVNKLTLEATKFYKSDKFILNPSFWTSGYATKPKVK